MVSAISPKNWKAASRKGSLVYTAYLADTRAPVALKKDEAVCAGQAALLQAAWHEARIHFEAALATGETPEALEGLGTAAWWLSDISTVFTARERAYRLYRESKEDRCAARV